MTNCLQAPSNNRFAFVTLAIFLLIWTALAISPSYRHDWLLENVLVFVGLPALLLIHRHLPLSRISYGLIFLFLCLHAVAAHYTYSEVPYDAWFESITGTTLNEVLGWDRNHFDRVVHFCWGLLLTYPVREIFIRVSNARGFWGYLFPFLVVISTSTIYELIEWFAAVTFGRADRMVCRSHVRWGTRRRLSRYAGRCLGCAERHAAGSHR